MIFSCENIMMYINENIKMLFFVIYLHLHYTVYFILRTTGTWYIIVYHRIYCDWKIVVNLI